MIYNLNEFWNGDGINNKVFLSKLELLNKQIELQKRKALISGKINISFFEKFEDKDALDITYNGKNLFYIIDPINNEISDKNYNFFADIDDFLPSDNYKDVMEAKKNEIITALYNSDRLIKANINKMYQYINNIKTNTLSKKEKETLKYFIKSYKNNKEYLSKLEDSITEAKYKILDKYNQAIRRANQINPTNNVQMNNYLNNNFGLNQVKQKKYDNYQVLQFNYNNNYNNNFINRNQKNKLNRLNPYDQNLNNIHNMENPFNSKNPYLPEIKQVNNKKVILPTLKNVFKGKQFK